jgi:hypothetical protein
MAQTLNVEVEKAAGGEQRLTYEGLRGRDTRTAERLIDSFLAVLQRMTPEERIRASRHGGFNRWERWVWAAHFANEVPVVNDEFEWISLASADLD